MPFITRTQSDGSTRTQSDGSTRNLSEVTFTNTDSRAGINLEELRYWQQAKPFVNVLKAGLNHISHDGNIGTWDDGRAITLNSDGYPTSLLTDQEITLLFMDDQSSNYPSGLYTIRFDGDGGWNGSTHTNLEITNFGSVTAEVEGEITVNWTPNDENTYIRIVGIGGSPLSNMRILMPGYESETETFHPDFVSLLSTNFKLLRFMKWQNIKDSTITTSSQATPTTYITYGHSDEILQPGGCPIEILVQLCNETNADMWWCVHHESEDALVTSDATYIQANLNADLRCFMEYSNETWNGAHTQKTYCDTQGGIRGLDTESTFNGNRRFHSERSQECFDLFEAQLGTGGRLVKVLGAWNANPSTNRLMMDHTHSSSGVTLTANCDAIAVAPYFGSPLTSDPQATVSPESPYTEITVDMTVAEIVQHADDDSSSTDLWTDRTKTNIDDAATRTLSCIAYESGQHLAGATGALRSNATLTSLFTDANHHPNMRTAYFDDLTQFEDGGGGVNCLFQLTARPGQGSGNWGLLDFQDQSTDVAYKWLGFQDWLNPVVSPSSPPAWSSVVSPEGDYAQISYDSTSALTQSTLDTTVNGFVTPALNTEEANRIVFFAHVTHTSGIPLGSTNNISLVPQFSMDGTHWSEVPASFVKIVAPSLDSSIPEGQLGYCDYSCPYIRFRHNGTDTQTSKKIVITVYRQHFGKSDRK